MNRRSFIPGRDKKERAKFEANAVVINNLNLEVQALQLMVAQKMSIKKLRGSWYNRFVCWMNNKNPIMTYVNIKKEYASRDHKGGDRQG